METVTKTGYWASHEYKRSSVGDLEGFCGWRPLLECIKHFSRERDRAFISTLFETGGRVSEVLQLRKENFEVADETWLLCRNMSLEKRYKKLHGYVDHSGRQRWLTEKIDSVRRPFPIRLNEPLVQYLTEWLSKLEQPSEMLFPSPVKPGKPLTRFWAYMLFSRMEKKLSKRLMQDLGFVNRKGESIDSFYPHWFRAQRASQLALDYGFSSDDLINFFEWKNMGTALHYARLSWRGLATKMVAHTYV